MNIIVALVLAFLTLFVVGLKRTYSQVPSKELKRRARDGDLVSAALYRVSVYGFSAQVFLWALIGIAASVFFMYVNQNMPIWLALIFSAGLIWLGFIWVPSGETSSLGHAIASHIAPVLAKIIYYMHPVTSKFERIANRLSRFRIHSGLYEKADLLDLIDRQQQQPDNRITGLELDIIRGTLTFGDKLVRDVMTPRRVVKSISTEEDLGPVTMSELHDSGHSRFPVYQDRTDNIVGTLFLRDLVKKRRAGKASSLMHKTVLYLHEEQTLLEALQAILITHHHMFIVVNSFEEYVGIVTIEDVLEQLVGRVIIDEFDEYEDLRSVAKKLAQKDHQKHLGKPKSKIKESEIDATLEID